jgi:hypothetical protein
VPKALLAAGLPLAAAALGEGRLLALENGLLTVGIPARAAAALKDAEQVRLIGSLVSAAVGQAVQLRLHALGGTAEPLDERHLKYQAAERHPFIQDLLKRFEGDLTARELVDFGTWLERVAAEKSAALAPVRPPPAQVSMESEDLDG